MTRKRTYFEIIRDTLHEHAGKLSLHDMQEIHRITTELLEERKGVREPHGTDWSWNK